MNLNTARVFVRNLAEAEDFYANTLQLPLRAGGAAHGYCVFAPGGIQLILEQVPPEAPEDDQALVGRFTGLSFAVGSVAEKYHELVARGVSFTGAPEPLTATSTSWNVTRMRFDPAFTQAAEMLSVSVPLTAAPAAGWLHVRPASKS